MSRSLIPAILCAVLGACATSNAELEETRKTIEGLVAEVTEAANALDANRLMKYMARDSGLTVIGDGYMVVGWEAVNLSQREHYATLFRIELEVEKTRVVVLAPDVAIATNTGSALEVPRVGEQRRGHFVGTIVWRRRAEGWRILQVHESTSP